MADEQIVRALLDANVKLTAELVKLATAVIGARPSTAPAGAPMAVVPFGGGFPNMDDWEDVPTAPPATPTAQAPATLHTPEEVEDADFARSMGQISSVEHAEILARAAQQAGLLNTAIDFA